jgi:hypothetical protein
LPPSTAAIPVAFRRGEEARIAVADNEGSVYCFRPSGERVWKYVRNSKAADMRRLAVIDLDGNGVNSIVMSDYRGHLYAIDAEGHLRFEVTATHFRISPAAGGIIGPEGRPGLVFGTDDKDLYAVRANGDLVWRAAVEGAVGRALPVVASLGLSEPVVLVPTPFVSAFQGIEAFGTRTGKRLWQAPSLLQSYQSTVVADIDGDGVPEILFGDKSDGVYCVDAHGQPRWAAHLDGRGIYFAPAVVDLEGKGRATIFQVVRAAGGNGKSLYVLDAAGTVVDSWDLPGGGADAPIACRWRDENEIHLLVVSGSGKLISYRLAQSPGAHILWPRLPGGASVANLSAEYSAPAVKTSSTAPAKIVPVSLGTTTLTEPAAGANLIALRVTDPDGTVHLSLLKSYNGEPVTGSLVAARPGDFAVRTEWFGNDSRPLRTEQTIYRAGAELKLPAFIGPGELVRYLDHRLAAARQLALASGKADDYDAAHAEAEYDKALVIAIGLLQPRGPIMVARVRNPWAQHTPTTLLAEGRVGKEGIHLRMLGNEYASAALALTNITARPLTLVLRSKIPSAVEFRDVPMVIPDTTGKPQEDPLPLLGRGQTMPLGAGETREVWLTLHSRWLESNAEHDATVQISILERVAPAIEIPLEIAVSHVRLPERFTYKHCNWLYLASIKDERVLDATLRDAVEHGTNVFNIPAPTVNVACDGTVTGTDSTAADRLIPRLPGAFFLVDGSVEPKFAAGCTPDAATRDTAYHSALHWFADHMQGLRLSAADYALYIEDEPGLNGADPAVDRYIAAVKRVKAADPQMQVYTDPAGGAWPSVIKPLTGLVDVWCPDLHLFRLHPAEMTAVFSQAKQFWHYEAPGDQRGLDPLGFYRVKPWIAFQLGMNGGGYWVYASKDYWIPSHESEYGVVYPGPQGPVTTKRWEASREGIQDYELLLMLQRAAKASASPKAQAALALMDEAVVFVTRGQEHATDISRHFHTYAPDFATWMDYRNKLIDAAEELIP